MIATTPTAVQDIVDNADERELWIVGREFERPPYFHRRQRVAIPGWPVPCACASTRRLPRTLTAAIRWKARTAAPTVWPTPAPARTQKASSKWCYHMVAVALYVEWQKRLRPTAPVALGTLRAGTLPLPPTTVDERLAADTAPYDPAPLTTAFRASSMPRRTL